MGRYGIALVACMIVLAGCAGPRVVSAGGDTVADLPAARGWTDDAYMLRTDLELGAAPAVDAVGEAAPAAADNEWPPCAPPPPPPVPAASAAAADETAPVETPPAAEAEVVEVTPADIEMETVPESAPTLGDCCGKPNCGCKKRCCGCRQCPCPDPCGNPCGGYVGGSFVAGPGFGFTFEGGMNLARNSSALWSVDLSLMYQDFSDDLSDGDQKNAGQMNMARVGFRARFAPCCKWHPTLRFGVAWMQAEGAPELLDLAEIDATGDYIGGYIGLGLEFDINAHWSTGPEFMLFGGIEAGNSDNTAVVPSLLWHLNYKF